MAKNRPEKFDGRPHIRLDHGMPENRKIVGLSDGAFRLFIEILCCCSRQESDGFLPTAQVKKMGSPKHIKELLNSDPEAPVLALVSGGYEVRDYLSHQRSRDEIKQLRDTKTASGELGAHTRWHLAKRRIDPNCRYCQEAQYA